MRNCFTTYYDPICVYLKKVGEMASANDFEITIRVVSLSAVFQFASKLVEIEVFGVPNFLLLLVISTTLFDAWFGIQKSIKMSKEFMLASLDFDVGSPEYKMNIKKASLHGFDAKKLQFTFFKCVTLLGYLYFAKNILEHEQESNLADIIGFASGIVTKAPLAIFWYYDFKSIGDNAEYLHGKKAPIFKIVEQIFEPRINRFFESNNNEPKG